MKKVAIDMEELIDAFENCSVELRYFLDIERGEIIFTPGYTGFEEEKEKFHARIDSNPERYLSIPERGSRKGYDEMADFAATVDDENLREKLAIALNGSGAFRRFKDVLLNYPEERQRWFEFRDDRAAECVEEWLEKNDLEIVGKAG